MLQANDILEKYSQKIHKINNKLALGHEDTLSFNYGYVYALFQAKLIGRKQKDILIKVYASTENDNCRFYIEDGILIDVETEN